MWGTKSVEFEWCWNRVVLSLWSSGREVAPENWPMPSSGSSCHYSCPFYLPPMVAGPSENTDQRHLVAAQLEPQVTTVLPPTFPQWRRVLRPGQGWDSPYRLSDRQNRQGQGTGSPGHNWYIKTIRLLDCQNLRLSDFQNIRLSDCHIVRLHTIRLSDCNTVHSKTLHRCPPMLL